LTRINGRTGDVVYSVPASSFHLRQGPDGLIYSNSRRHDPATGAAVLPWSATGGTGLDFGADGRLYVGWSDSIRRYDAITGKALDFFVPFRRGNLDRVEAVRFGPDGHLYVTGATLTAPRGSRVLRFHGMTGAFIDYFVNDPQLAWPRSLDWGPNGNLFVASFGTTRNSGSILEFNGTTGAFERVIADGLDLPNGLAFGPDGNLYVGLEWAGTIKRYNGTTGAFIDDFATGLPGSIIGITWATVTVPEPTSGIQAAAFLLVFRQWNRRRRYSGAY
jgi:sugar lactone lactonase YvrE